MSVSKMIGFHLVLLAIIVAVDSAPSGFLVKLMSDCEYEKSGDELMLAMLTIKSDLPRLSITHKAECLENDLYFDKLDDQTYQLPVFYDIKDGAGNCTFRNVSRYLFTMKVFVAYGSPGSYIQQYEEQFTVACGPGYGTGSAIDFEVDEGFLTPEEITSYTGNFTQNVTMTVINVLGQDIGKDVIAIGRMIQLRANITGSSEGILATSCFAIGDNGIQYQFLRGGCGDGLVMGKSEGFDSSFYEAVSEPFGFFTIEGAAEISFFCNFSVCETRCNKVSLTG
ncbi:hypothetical protein ScPMuIL_011919 [Solemya velum]